MFINRSEEIANFCSKTLTFFLQTTCLTYHKNKTAYFRGCISILSHEIHTPIVELTNNIHYIEKDFFLYKAR